MKQIFYALATLMVFGLQPDSATGVILRSNKICKVFDCPMINDSHVVITPSSCNGSDGSITGITGTGTGKFTFIWRNADYMVISTDANLMNVGTGVYTLFFSDQSKCTPAKKSYIVGQKNGVIIDDSQTKINAASCNSTDGSITNINVQNATSYKWYSNETLVATTVNLNSVTNGSYKLVAANDMGCSSTNTYFVPSASYFPLITHLDTTNGVCGVSAGIINITFSVKPTDPPFTYYVFDDGGQQVSTGDLLYSSGSPSQILVKLDAPNAVFSLVLIDNKGCVNIVGKYSLPPPVFAITTTHALIRNDACGRHTGGVFNLGLTGGSGVYYGHPPADAYTWTDSLGQVIAQTPDLTSVSKGTYTLVVKDIHGCSDSKQFAILDSLGEARPPTVSGTSLCLPGVVTISVIDPISKLAYRLYDSTQTAITENAYGVFQLKVSQTSTYYVSALNGLCESDKTPVIVTIIAPGVIIPNTFTPNNDGINDLWNIPHIYDFPGAEVSVFSRDGQLIYHSINYARPFDGKLNELLLPAGVYYYVVDLKKQRCYGKISGSLTIIR